MNEKSVCFCHSASTAPRSTQRTRPGSPPTQKTHNPDLLCPGLRAPSGNLALKENPRLVPRRRMGLQARRPRLGWEGACVHAESLLFFCSSQLCVSARALDGEQRKEVWRACYIHKRFSSGSPSGSVGCGSLPLRGIAAVNKSRRLTHKHIVLRIRWRGAARKTWSGFTLHWRRPLLQHHGSSLHSLFSSEEKNPH